MREDDTFTLQRASEILGVSVGVLRNGVASNGVLAHWKIGHGRGKERTISWAQLVALRCALLLSSWEQRMALSDALLAHFSKNKTWPAVSAVTVGNSLIDAPLVVRLFNSDAEMAKWVEQDRPISVTFGRPAAEAETIKAWPITGPQLHR
jgi:hypothetical protein